jgi:hypothetical protein
LKPASIISRPRFAWSIRMSWRCSLNRSPKGYGSSG